MSESTFTKITFKSEKEACSGKAIITNYLNNYSGNVYEDELEKYEKDLLVEKETIIAEDSYSIISDTFWKLVPEMAKELAKNDISSFELVAIIESYNCGLEAEVLANYKDNTLTIKKIYSDNGDGFCPECGEQVVIFDEYDPNEKYYCPECGEELDHSEMFGGYLPQIEFEEIIIK